MERPGLRLTGLRGSLEVAAAVPRQVKVRLTGGTLLISDEGLRWLLPPGVPLKIERISRGHLFVQATAGPFPVDAEFWPTVSPGGRIRLEPVSARIIGIGFPGGAVRAVTGFLRDKLVGKPGLHLGAGNVLEIDLGEILRHVAGVEVPPLKAVRAGEGVAELEF